MQCFFFYDFKTKRNGFSQVCIDNACKCPSIKKRNKYDLLQCKIIRSEFLHSALKNMLTHAMGFYDLKQREMSTQHEISNNVVCATNKASDQPVYTHSLIRAFASRWNIQ